MGLYVQGHNGQSLIGIKKKKLQGGVAYYCFQNHKMYGIHIYILFPVTREYYVLYSNKMSICGALSMYGERTCSLRRQEKKNKYKIQSRRMHTLVNYR